ncbi:Uncharacterised protein [Bordetella trematum]|uniref:Uncharacterized protein n=1 Tax=Bordetella trematum TaxID=123899 RepID=A0A157SKA7_9BORD|nr:Uncharacterised protein [Bordetella trematum]SAI19671.1 Uncharacterised protein [Bordetella trematum]SAI70898.1 Uncharacterised protein [Bordetella trematum]SUV98479.1 Uncharacterised protein [Bordetella trematum]
MSPILFVRRNGGQRAAKRPATRSNVAWLTIFHGAAQNL